MSKIQLITVVTRTTEHDYKNHPLFSIETDETNILRHLSEWLDLTMNLNDLDKRVFDVPENLKNLYDENCYDPMLNPFYQGLAKNGTLKGFPYLIKGDNPTEEITPVLAVIPAMAGVTPIPDFFIFLIRLSVEDLNLLRSFLRSSAVMEFNCCQECCTIISTPLYLYRSYYN